MCSCGLAERYLCSQLGCSRTIGCILPSHVTLGRFMSTGTPCKLGLYPGCISGVFTDASPTSGPFVHYTLVVFVFVFVTYPLVGAVTEPGLACTACTYASLTMKYFWYATYGEQLASDDQAADVVWRRNSPCIRL